MNRISASSFGPCVGIGRGEIIAAFANSAYAEIRGEVVCLLPASGPDGAIHARISTWPGFSCGEVIELCLGSSATIWLPPAWPICDLATANLRLERFGVERIDDPHCWLGRGEGLTPDGDDRLAGWLIARYALAVPVDARELLIQAESRTHALSLAHLRAAAQGAGTAPFHDVLAQLLDPACPDPNLEPLQRIGSNSGHAGFRGALAALADFADRGYGGNCPSRRAQNRLWRGRLHRQP